MRQVAAYKKASGMLVFPDYPTWRACSSVEITEQYLEQLEAAEPQVLSFITVAAESARAAARQLDDRIAREGTSGLEPLAGVPLGIKVRMQSEPDHHMSPCDR